MRFKYNFLLLFLLTFIIYLGCPVYSSLQLENNSVLNQTRYDGRDYFYNDRPEEVYAYSYKSAMTSWLTMLWSRSDDEGYLKGYKSINVFTLSLLYRRYLSVPYIKQWVRYIDYGVNVVLVPHFGFGQEYYFNQSMSYYHSISIGVLPIKVGFVYRY